MIADVLLGPFAKWAAETIDGAHPRDPVLRRLFGGGASTAAGVPIDEQRSLGYPAVWRGVNILSNGVAKVPLFVMRRLGASRKTRDRQHPAYRLLHDAPNMDMQAGVFKRTLQHHSLLWGNGYAKIERDQAGRPIELIPLLPDRTRPVRLQQFDGQLMYQTVIGNQTRFFLPDNVLHIRGLGFDGLAGYPVVELLKESLGLGMAAREFGARFFGQGATASGIITLPEGMDEQAEENFLSSIHQAHANLGKAHRLMLLEDGAKFQQTTIPPEHAQFLQTREFEVREIGNIIGIQSHKLGDPSRKSYNSLEQSNQEHLDDDLEPWLCSWEEECGAKLLTEQERDEDTHFIRFERKALMRTNLAARTTHYASGRQWGYYSANDVRALEDMDDIGPEGDQYLVPANMRPADAPLDATEATAVLPDNRDAQAGLLADLLTRIAKRIGAQARRKAKDVSSYCQWVDAWRADNAEVIGRMAAPIAAVLATIPVVPITNLFVTGMAHDFGRIADQTTPDLLSETVESAAADWESRQPADYARKALEMKNAAL